MKWGKQKKEGWLGVILTVVLCLGFLYWWFRPEPRVWEQENAGQLVTRAMAEPKPDSRVERQVIEFDLMEVAICQARIGMLEQAMATAKHITDPVIRLRAVRQLAQASFHSTSQDFGEALGLADLLSDPAERAEIRGEVLGQLALLGFVDAALPEAKSAPQKAALARYLARPTPESQDKARELLAEVEKELPSLDPAAAAAVRENIAWTRIILTPADGAGPAIVAIKALPVERQPQFWQELFSWCDGEKIRLPDLMPHIADPALRRSMEIKSLLFDKKPWPAEELIAKYRAEAETAASPEAKVTALLSVAGAQTNAGPDNSDAGRTLREARAIASAITDSASRCRLLLALTHQFSLALLWDDAKSALEEAAITARAAEPVSTRVSLLVGVAEESFLQANAPDADALLTRATAGAESAAIEPPALTALALVLVRRGDWPRGLALIDRIPDDDARLSALETAAETAAVDSLSMDPAEPPPRGEPVDGIRRASAGDQVRAASLVEQQPEGYARSRAWLAMAKGLIVPPSSLNDYMAEGSQPADASSELPDDAAGETPASEPPESP